MSTTNRTHNCHADSNLQLISAYTFGNEIVSTYRCRRCEGQWTDRTPIARVMAGLRSPSPLTLTHDEADAFARAGRDRR